MVGYLTHKLRFPMSFPCVEKFITMLRSYAGTLHSMIDILSGLTSSLSGQLLMSLPSMGQHIGFTFEDHPREIPFLRRENIHRLSAQQASY